MGPHVFYLVLWLIALCNYSVLDRGWDEKLPSAK